MTYSIAAELGFNLPDELAMDSTTGQLCIALPLDYESTSSYEFPVTASDQGMTYILTDNMQICQRYSSFYFLTNNFNN